LETTLLFFKPDGLCLESDILRLIRRRNLFIERLGTIRFNEEIIRRFYPALDDQIIKLSVQYLAGYDLPVYVVTGKNTIRIIKDIKKHVREKHGKGRTGAIIHSTNHAEEYCNEIAALRPHII